MLKAFSNFDRPPPGLTAYQSRFEIGESATVPGLLNAWASIVAITTDVVKNWDAVYKVGINATNYIGDASGALGGIPDFGYGCLKCVAPVGIQG